MSADPGLLFAQHRATLAAAGIPLRAQLRPTHGMLSFYAEGVVHLAYPSDDPGAALQTALLAAMAGLSEAELKALFDLLLPRLVAHEIGHALRDEAGRLGDDPLVEEQAAERFAELLSRPWLDAADRARAQATLAALTRRLGGTAGAAAIHRHAAVAAARLGLHADPEEAAAARAVIAAGAAQDIAGWLRVAVAWAWLDLTLDLEDSLDDIRADLL